MEQSDELNNLEKYLSDLSVSDKSNVEKFSNDAKSRIYKKVVNSENKSFFNFRNLSLLSLALAFVFLVVVIGIFPSINKNLTPINSNPNDSTTNVISSDSNTDIDNTLKALDGEMNGISTASKTLDDYTSQFSTLQSEY